MMVSPSPDIQGRKVKSWNATVDTTSTKMKCHSTMECLDPNCIKKFYPSPIEDSEAFAANPHPYSFLLVDDNEINLRIFRRILLKLFPNASICTVQDPALVEISHTTLLQYHVIFLDIEMPIVTGTEFALRVRSSRELDHVGLIAVTTKYLCADLELYEKLGFDFTFRKPVEYPTNYILRQVEQVLAIRGSGRL